MGELTEQELRVAFAAKVDSASAAVGKRLRAVDYQPRTRRLSSFAGVGALGASLAAAVVVAAVLGRTERVRGLDCRAHGTLASRRQSGSRRLWESRQRGRARRRSAGSIHGDRVSARPEANRMRDRWTPCPPQPGDLVSATHVRESRQWQCDAPDPRTPMVVSASTDRSERDGRAGCHGRHSPPSRREKCRGHGWTRLVSRLVARIGQRQRVPNSDRDHDSRRHTPRVVRRIRATRAVRRVRRGRAVPGIHASDTRPDRPGPRCADTADQALQTVPHSLAALSAKRPARGT
jgi:hypothetical protein